MCCKYLLPLGALSFLALQLWKSQCDLRAASSRAPGVLGALPWPSSSQPFPPSPPAQDLAPSDRGRLEPGQHRPRPPVRPHPRPCWPSRAGWVLLAPVSRAAPGDAGRDWEAPGSRAAEALRMRARRGRGSQERRAGDGRGGRCARGGDWEGWDSEWGRQETSRGSWIWTGRTQRSPRRGALGTQAGRADGGRGRDGAQVAGIWKDFGAQTPRTALAWVD